MQFKGYLSFSVNSNVFFAKPYDSIIIVSSDAESITKQFPANTICGSVLLPPYESMSFYVDGNQMAFEQSYQLYLSTGPAKEFLDVVVTALLAGKLITIYVPLGEIEIGFFTVLYKFIENIYGLSGDTEESPMIYNQMFDIQVLTILLVAGLIDLETFILEYPESAPIVQDAIPTLMSMVQAPSSGDLSFFIQWYTDFKDRCKKANCVLERLVTKG